MNAQKALSIALPKIKKDILATPTPRVIHILDMVRSYNLPDECCTSLAVKLAASKLPLYVFHTLSAGPFHHEIHIY